MLGVAVSALLSIGSGVLWYLRAEFVTEKTDANPLLGPIPAILSVANQAKASVLPWISVSLALLFSASIAAGVKRWRAKQQLIHH